MNTKNLFTTLLVFVSLSLMGSGLYLFIDNIIKPQGFLFESAVLFTMGSILLVLMTAISFLVKTINLFSDVYSKQIEMQTEMANFYTKTMSASRPKTLGDMLGSSITVTNMETGETSSAPLNSQDPLGKLNEMISNALSGKRSGSYTKLEDMNIEQLEAELSKAVKADQFERAKEIKELIQKKRDSSAE